LDKFWFAADSITEIIIRITTVTNSYSSSHTLHLQRLNKKKREIKINQNVIDIIKTILLKIENCLSLIIIIKFQISSIILYFY
jgi:hypothetical protein